VGRRKSAAPLNFTLGISSLLNTPFASNQFQTYLLGAIMLFINRTILTVLSLIYMSCGWCEQQSENKLPIPTASSQLEASIQTGKAKDLIGSAAKPLTVEQIRTNLPVAPADKFEFLRNQRKITLDAISNVSSQIVTVDAKISSLQAIEGPEMIESAESNSERVERVKNDLARATEQQTASQRNLDALKASKATNSKIDRASSELENRKQFVYSVQRYLDQIKSSSARNEEIKRLRSEREELSANLLAYQRLLGSIDDMVNQLFIASDATNSFKLKMSIAFSVLVGVVIIGFFGIAWSNDEIKKTIFANEAGIQFITVFSIVIAVILFGIIGVLESKELSALLGGLSGYILGKGRGQSDNK
jgi:hypothetical protein